MSISVPRHSRWMGLYLLLFGCHHDPGSELIAQLRNPDVDMRREPLVRWVSKRYSSLVLSPRSRRLWRTKMPKCDDCRLVR